MDTLKESDDVHVNPYIQQRSLQASGNSESLAEELIDAYYNEDSIEDKDDVAKHMGKSFVGLLTTASMYSGNIQSVLDDNIEDIEEIDEENNKLSDIEDEQVVEDFPCWLLKDVLLQGHIYLTNQSLIFLANLPISNDDKPCYSGNLSMEVNPSKRLIRYYATLQNNSLSFYNKSTDLYFPILTIDLKNVIKIEIIGNSFLNNNENWIKVITDSKSFNFKADSKHSARSWLGHLKKQLFKTNNNSNLVKIKFPLQNILSIEKNLIFDNTHTLKFKILENLNSYIYDDYFFMFFNNGLNFFNKINNIIDNLNSLEIDNVVDSTINLNPNKPTRLDMLTDFKDNLINLPSNLIKNSSSMWNSNPSHYPNELFDNNDEFLVSADESLISTKRFQSYFSLPENHLLVSTYYCYLHKNLPIYGKIYISSTEICFRSLIYGVKTKMILPLHDIENVIKEKGFRFGYYGLVLIISGHEELFIEFSTLISRDDCEFILLKQLEKKDQKIETPSVDLDTAKIKLFEDKIYNESGLDIPIIIENNSFKTIKPEKFFKFGLLTIGSRGDVQPYIALALGLMKDGHQVTIITHLEFKNWVESYNINFKEIAGNPAELMSLMVQHGSMNVGLLKEASSKFRGWIDELLITSWNACKSDVDILIESPSAMSGIHIAEALGIPYFRAFTMPWTRTRAYPHAFIVPNEKKGGSYNYLTHVLFENIFWKGISSQINNWRVNTLNLSKTNLTNLQQNKTPFLYNVSPIIMPPPVDYNDWVKVTGYWFLNESSSYEPSAELLEFIAAAKKEGKKLVYIGFGSIVVSNSKELTRAIIESVLESDVRCILNKGWSERLDDPLKNEMEIELPKEIYNSGSIPHDWLFPQIDAAVHHGGSGTTGATLKFGLPSIIKPFFGDQFFYANRIEDIGCGLQLKKLNVSSLSKALKEITTNSRIILKSKDYGSKILKENGVQNAINMIYNDLNYAKELILEKRKNVDDANEDDWLLV